MIFQKQENISQANGLNSGPQAMAPWASGQPAQPDPRLQMASGPCKRRMTRSRHGHRAHGWRCGVAAGGGSMAYAWSGGRCQQKEAKGKVSGKFLGRGCHRSDDSTTG
jgi:hypothetical protein